MLVSVCFCGREAMEKHLQPSLDTFIISITDPDRPPASIPDGFGRVLRLSFDDVSEEYFKCAHETFHDMQPDCSKLIHAGHVLPDANDALAIVDYVGEMTGSNQPLHLVVHCEDGISRSDAVAAFMADVYDTPIDTTHSDTAGANPRLTRLLRKVNGLQPMQCWIHQDNTAQRAPESVAAPWP